MQIEEAQIFKALGDPLRLIIVKRLSDGSTYTLGDITAGLGMTRQGARKQIRVLESANLVHLKPNGREVNVTLNIKQFKSGKDFIEDLETKWDKRLSKLKDFLEKR